MIYPARARWVVAVTESFFDPCLYRCFGDQMPALLFRKPLRAVLFFSLYIIIQKKRDLSNILPRARRTPLRHSIVGKKNTCQLPISNGAYAHSPRLHKRDVDSPAEY